ncbi:hypothetical protein Hanom_Chr09g00837091 [Helianthus anomalus]
MTIFYIQLIFLFYFAEKMVLLHGIKVVRDSVGPDTDHRTNMYPILIFRLLYCFFFIGHECKKKQYII